MNCPISNVELKPADREGIEVDYCPKCRGVWVARDELDRILSHPTPFDINWRQNDQRASHSDRARWSGCKQGPKPPPGPQPSFWSDLFA